MQRVRDLHKRIGEDMEVGFAAVLNWQIGKTSEKSACPLFLTLLFRNVFRPLLLPDLGM